MAEHNALDLNALRTELARSGARWRAVDTTVAMADETVRRRLLGVPLPEAGEAERLIAQAKALHQPGGNGAGPTAADGGIGLATSFDARNVNGANYVTAIKDQEWCGSCVAFGTLATLETTAAFQRGQPGLELDLSEQHLFFVLGPATGASCANGWWPEFAYAACQATGVTFEDYMPYNPGGGGILNTDWPNRLAQITGTQTLTGNVPAMKQHILTHGAVSACFFVYEDFSWYGGGVYTHTMGALEGGHCVSLVGFDDQQGCWIAKNSWNASWGEQGFFRIGYGECGIETWRVHGADFVNLRMWVDAYIRGLWSNESPDNAYAYLDNLGWARLAYGAPGANLAMLTELTSSRLRNRPIHGFHDNGQLTQTYVF
jgi:C1A family cysteine protease